jgi:hypothetical protein
MKSTEVGKGEVRITGGFVGVHPPPIEHDGAEQNQDDGDEDEGPEERAAGAAVGLLGEEVGESNVHQSVYASWVMGSGSIGEMAYRPSIKETERRPVSFIAERAAIVSRACAS